MSLHDSAFQYLNPTAEQKDTMSVVRDGFAHLAKLLGSQLPDGPDKTHTLRVLRTAGMWANIAITRHPDGTPR